MNFGRWPWVRVRVRSGGYPRVSPLPGLFGLLCAVLIEVRVSFAELVRWALVNLAYWLPGPFDWIMCRWAPGSYKHVLDQPAPGGFRVIDVR